MFSSLISFGCISFQLKNELMKHTHFISIRKRGDL